jgi:hypothetical protein
MMIGGTNNDLRISEKDLKTEISEINKKLQMQQYLLIALAVLILMKK